MIHGCAIQWAYRSAKCRPRKGAGQSNQRNWGGKSASRISRPAGAGGLGQTPGRGFTPADCL